MFNEETPLKRFFYFTGKDKKGNKTKVDFGFIPKLDDISLGEFIDLEGFMGDWSTMHKAMNVLFRPIKKSRVSRWFRLKTTYYTIQDYDGKGVYEENMKDMPLDVALGAVVFFLSFRDKIVTDYDTLYSTGNSGQQHSAQTNFGSRWGWYPSIKQLAGGNVFKLEEATKLNIHTAFTDLAYEKEKNDLESLLIKKAYKK